MLYFDQPYNNLPYVWTGPYDCFTVELYQSIISFNFKRKYNRMKYKFGSNLGRIKIIVFIIN